jgi:hypothetical protein
LKIIRNLILFLLLATAAYYLVPIAYFNYWTSWSAQAKEPLNVLSTEYAVGGRGVIDAPLASVETNETVDVISQANGKDYVACYIRTHKRVRGWVSCTSLTRQ